MKNLTTAHYLDTLQNYLQAIQSQIADAQAQIDDLEMFGGSSEQESQLRIQLAELQDKKARMLQAIEVRRRQYEITLEKGDTIQPTRQGGWGRLHYVSRAIGPRKPQRNFWICSGCHQEIEHGREHYRRSYYTDKRDNRSSAQIRLCLGCYEAHAEQYPCNTLFPVYRPARRKVAVRKAA